MTRFAQSLRTAIVTMSVALLVSAAATLLTPQAVDAQDCWICWFNPNASDETDNVHCSDTGMMGLSECEEPNGSTCELSGSVCNWLVHLDYSEDGTVAPLADDTPDRIGRRFTNAGDVQRSCDGVLLGSYRRDPEEAPGTEIQLTLDL